MKRIEYIRTMKAEEMAKVIRNIVNLELDDYCKNRCDYANTLEDEPIESECVKCCIEWLNEELVQQ